MVSGVVSSEMITVVFPQMKKMQITKMRRRGKRKKKACHHIQRRPSS